MSDLPAAQAAFHDETQRRTQLLFKALPILLIPVISGALALLVIRGLAPELITPGQGLAGDHPPAVIGIIVMAVFLTALIMLVRLGRPTMSALLLIGVWTLFTTFASLRGGVSSIGPAFLVIPICAAGLLIDGVGSLSLAAMSTVLVGSMAWLEVRGLYRVSDPLLPKVSEVFPLVALPFFAALVWVGLFWTVALLTSLLAGGLQRALSQSRKQAAELRELSEQLEARVADQTVELARRAARAEALYEVSQALTSTLDLDHVLALIAEQAARLLGFDRAQVLLSQPDGNFATLGAYPQHPPPFDESNAAALEPILAEVGRQRKPRYVSLRTPHDMADGGQRGADSPSASLVLPMRYRSGIAGVLLLANANGEANCSEDDLVLGQGLADQAAVAIANAQLLNQSREAAILEERTRLARDIHDTLAQGLTGVVVQLGAAQRALPVAPIEAREHLALGLRMARESLAEARRSVWNLRDPALQRGDLSDFLKALTIRPLGAKVAVTFEPRGERYPLSSAVESTLLRVCQEALTNVAKHAQATEANVSLEYQPDEVRLVIRDNGIGFDPMALEETTTAPGPWGGFGLVGMRERVHALGGRLEISSGAGAQVLVVIPRGAQSPPEFFESRPVGGPAVSGSSLAAPDREESR